MAHQLTSLQVQAMRPSLFSVATALRVGIGNRGDDIVDLTPQTACRNAIAAVRYASPLLEKGILITAPFAILGYGIYRYVWKGLDLGTVVAFIRSRFVASVTIPAKYVIHEQVMAWMSTNHVGEDTRCVTVHSNLAAAAALGAFNPNPYLPRGRHDSYDSYASDDPLGDQGKPKEPSLSYVPAVGSTAFSFNGHRLWIQRQSPTEHPILDSYGRPTKGKSQPRESDITISCYNIFGGVKPVQDFLEHVSSINEVKNESSVRIYRLSRHANEGETWDRRVITRPARKLDSVSMEESKKQDLIEDINTYLSPESKSWYANRGIPWRRGYLFYGPPGTGKTSFCTALAGHFGMPLYILSLSNSHITDVILEMCFDSLPIRCIVLIEDVDSAGIERAKKKKVKKSSKHPFMAVPPAPKGVSLAGLLNTIDGPVSHEGRVLVMTSNSPDNLDAAMLRPGRVDKKILFGNASHEVVEQLFLHIYAEAPGEKTEKSAAPEHDLPALARQFARSIPEDKLSPAEIQNYLLNKREDPMAAIDSAASWSESTLKTKSQGRNVEKFEGQVGVDADVTLQQSKADEALKPILANQVYHQDGAKSMYGAVGGTLPDKLTDSWSDLSPVGPLERKKSETEQEAKQGQDNEEDIRSEDDEKDSAETSETGDEEDSDEEADQERLRWKAASRNRQYGQYGPISSQFARQMAGNFPWQ
ncbi:hypothetical protein PRZ48_001901 [Zasmidium cellare]|uniref:Mitochondrial chaperone BCS1 n=1 Tax=Zasmidium cellare TaxID=395010 RepID=A0ABR0F535_ZASCE|nr:hypothetical protein PRZ48_001901 [Zasmidium cellare]